MKMNTKKFLPLFFLLPALIVIFVVTIFPLIYSLGISLMNIMLVAGVEPRFVGLDNYVKMFYDDVFKNSIIVSLLYPTIAISLELLLGLGIAVFVNNSVKRGKRAVRLAITLPMVMTPVYVGFAFKMILNPKIGILNYILRFFGIPIIDWLGDSNIALLSVALVDVWMWAPFIFLILYAAMQAIPPEILEAATLDGASGFTILTRMILPLIKPAIVVAVILRLMDTLKIFDYIWLMTHGGPALATDVLSVFIYRNAFKYWYISYMSAVSWAYLAIFTIAAMVFFKATKFKI